MNIRKLILFCLMTGFSTMLSGQAVIPEGIVHYSGKFGSAHVMIEGSPFSLTVSNELDKILSISRITGVGGRPSEEQHVTGFSRNDNEITMVITSGKSKYFLSIKLNDNILDIKLIPPGKTETGKIGFSFDTRTSGHWFGGAVVKGHLWPLEASSFAVDPFWGNSNQASPVWYTSSGAGIFSPSYHTMGYSFNKPEQGIFELYAKDCNEFRVKIVAGANIREAYAIMSELVGFPGVTPPYDYFAYPQFNTWIEFQTAVNQEGIENYVRELRKNEFPSRLFMIDDKWTVSYGDTEFDRSKFPDPAKMISFLHENNFSVMLWMTPFIQESSKNFSVARDRGYLIMEPDGKTPYLSEWWNGTDALVDLSNPEAYSWFLGLLKDMKERYGVDGFKLDAGDAEYLKRPFRSFGDIKPNHYTDLFASLGKHFPANELRVSWLAQSMGLIERLRDKGPNWSEVDGINALVPHALTSSLIGYLYTCPDLIGGGLDGGFRDKDYKFDEELFIRWTQASAFMPMMQYSLAPWRLSRENMLICKKYADIHAALGDYIYKLAEQARLSGIPIVRPLFFEFPLDEKTFFIRDQFMLGERFLVAPVLQKGAVSRDIYFPAGTWSDFTSGRIIKGGVSVNYSAPLDLLPVFIRID